MSIGPESNRKDSDRSSAGAAAAAPAGRALVRIIPRAHKAKDQWGPQHAVWAAGFVLALGLGVYGVQSVRSSAFWSAGPDPAKRQADATAQLLRRLSDDVGRLKGSVDTLRTAQDAAKPDDQLRGLKKSLDSLKQEIDQVKTADGATLAQLSTKFDKVDHDPSQKLADIVARLDKLDHDTAGRGADVAGQKVADLDARLGRVERQVSASLPTGSIPAQAHGPAAAPVPIQPLATAQPKPAAKPQASASTTVEPAADLKTAAAKPPTVDSWVLRDVYDGMALVEARHGDLREISPGEFLPGAGEVRSIERRGKSWVVVTSRGVIENSTF